ncbi:hypothetical protein SGRIM128S_09402 [Streptomyces griseomycini]
MSKLGEESESTASPSPAPKRELRSARLFITPRCSSAMGLGAPVEPEVWMT